MIDYISFLLNFFKSFSDDLIKKNIMQPINQSKINIDYSSKVKKGDVSSNFYLITKKRILDHKFDLKNNLSKKLDNLSFIDHHNFSKNGFINIFLKKNYLCEQLKLLLIKKEKFGLSNYGNNKKINIEFVSANPTGPITVAHMRGAVLGDVLGSILENTGYKITREYYVNDAGSQIDILGNSLFKRYSELFGIKINFNDDEYPGDYLVELSKKIKNEFNDFWLKEKESKRKNFFKNYAVRKLIDNIKFDLNLLNINFDNFIFESEIVKNKLIDELFFLLDKKNLLYQGILDKPKSDNFEDWEPRKQLLFKSTEIFDDKDRALKKVNGEWTYFANDAAYHLDKYKRKFDKLINIWGADHIGYIPRMRSVLKSLTGKDNYLDIVTCQIVRLIKDKKIFKMSKRKGNFITLNEVFNAVGKDPLRYFMISTRSETAMDFDMNKVVEKNKDNPVFYCQYAYARSSSIINKAKEMGINIDNYTNFEQSHVYYSDDEIDIILKILSYPFVLLQSSIYKEPHRLTNYIEDISSSFHSFWNKGKDNQSLRFIDKENLNKTKSKLIWLNAFRIVLNNIFNIIGIDSPEVM